MSQAAAFAVNATLVASQWQHRAFKVVFLHPIINAEHEPHVQFFKSLV